MPASATPLPLSMEDRACPVCGSRDQSQVYAEAKLDAAQLDAFAFASRKSPEYQHHRLVVCPSCRVLYASPVPAAGARADAYREAAFDSAEEARFAARTYARFLPQVIRQIPDASAALDIGTGDGAFLEELLAAGFAQVTGVEPSAAPVRAARSGIRERIIHDIFRPEAFAPASLSLVSCFQTFEHVPDPLGLCRGVLDLLKPGGALLIVSHDRRSLPNRLMGLRSPIIDVEHLQLFCRSSMRVMLETAGFTGVRTMGLWNRYPLHYWFRLFPLPRAFKEKLLPKLKASAVGRIALSVPAGNQVAIAFKPAAGR